MIGINNLFELEGVIDSWDSCVNFLNRSIPFFPKEKVSVKLKEQRILTLEVPFVEEISGMAITKMLDAKEQKTLTMKLKFIRNRAIFKVTNSTHEMVTFDPKEMLGIVDLRSLGYYKIKQGVLQQNLRCMYHFESVNKVCDQFNRLINILKKEEEETCNTDKYPWLDDSDERKHMTDREILDKYIDLEGSCLTKWEKQKLRSLIYDYKDAFSLRDEIGMCQRMPMGLNISPAVWQSYINAILSGLSSRKYCEAIMDDLLLFTPNKQIHFEKLIDLLQLLCKNGLKISPKKCQLFKTELQYMGNTIFIKEKRVCVKPLRSRLEAIQKLKPPMNQKDCRSFAGIVNFISIFCPELQKLLKPIYELTKKGRHFVFEDEQQKAFDEIKSR